MNNGYKIIAVDFDGTLSFGEWPEVGPANKGLIDYLKRQQRCGDKLILWTCRAGKELDIAIDWCKENGLKFDAINDNLPEITQKYGNNSRKITCDVYIDDKAVNAWDYGREEYLSRSFDYDHVQAQLIKYADALAACS